MSPQCASPTLRFSLIEGKTLYQREDSGSLYSLLALASGSEHAVSPTRPARCLPGRGPCPPSAAPPPRPSPPRRGLCQGSSAGLSSRLLGRHRLGLPCTLIFHTFVRTSLTLCSLHSSRLWDIFITSGGSPMPFGLSPAPSRPHPIPTDVPVLGGVRAPGPHATGCARGPVSVAGVSLRSSRLTAAPLCGRPSSDPFVVGIGSLARVAVTSHPAVTQRSPSLLFWVAILGQTVTARSDFSRVL